MRANPPAPDAPAPESGPSAFLALADHLAPLLDFVDGQRAEFERRGYSPTACEAMAVHLYTTALSGLFRPTGAA